MWRTLFSLQVITVMPQKVGSGVGGIWSVLLESSRWQSGILIPKLFCQDSFPSMEPHESSLLPGIRKEEKNCQRQRKDHQCCIFFATLSNITREQMIICSGFVKVVLIKKLLFVVHLPFSPQYTDFAVIVAKADKIYSTTNENAKWPVLYPFQHSSKNTVFIFILHTI